MSFQDFFAQYGLILLLVALLVFMFWSSRRRMARQKAEQETKARQTVPGAEVLLQGGLYGTIVSFDPDNLDEPATVEIAPGVEIKVHSQAILRVVTASDVVTEDDFSSDDTPVVEVADDDLPAVPDDARDIHGKTDPDADTKPQA